MIFSYFYNKKISVSRPENRTVSSNLRESELGRLWCWGAKRVILDASWELLALAD